MAKREKLTADKIVKAAMGMIDEGGEKSFSMRKLAAALGVDPMAIYHHHANRGALIHEVMQALMQDCQIPDPTGDWRSDLSNLCRSIRDLAKRHPGAFRIYEVYEHWLTAEHRLHEAFYAGLTKAGFSPRATVQATRLLLSYTEAFAVDEISGWLEPENRADLAGSLSDGPYTTTLDLVDEIISPDKDADFEFGLNVILRGLEAELPG